MTRILPFTGHGEPETLRQQLAKICLESAAIPVEEGEKREIFLKRWLFQYLDLFPEYAFVAVDERSGQALGYVLACPQTEVYKEKLDQKGLDLWCDHYPEYPAHLHINCAQEARGLGLGGRLLRTLEESLSQKGISGLHLVTSEGNRNVSFYLKNGHAILDQKKLNDTPVVLMGKKLGKNCM